MLTNAAFLWFKNSNIVKHNFTFSSWELLFLFSLKIHSLHMLLMPGQQVSLTEQVQLFVLNSVESVLAPSWQVSWCLDPVRQCKCKTNGDSNPLSMQEMKGYKELIKQENMSSYNPADGESHCVTILQNQTWGILKHVNTLHRQVVI